MNEHHYQSRDGFRVLGFDSELSHILDLGQYYIMQANKEMVCIVELDYLP